MASTEERRDVAALHPKGFFLHQPQNGHEQIKIICSMHFKYMMGLLIASRLMDSSDLQQTPFFQAQYRENFNFFTGVSSEGKTIPLLK